MEATYAKLKDGSWGIRITGVISGAKIGPGVECRVKKKDGKTNVETVAKVLWTDNKIYLCQIKQAEKSTSRQCCAACGSTATRLHYDMEDGMMKCYECCDMPR